MGFVTILASKLANLPVITIIRDSYDICPKHVDIIKYGVACQGLENKKTCDKCIEYWRSLRILINNKPPGWNKSFEATYTTILYKLRYFVCRFNLFLLSQSKIVLVASKFMRNILSQNIPLKKLDFINITPISQKSNHYFKKKNQFLFIQSKFGGSHKGSNFILRLVKNIPDDFKIVIAGGDTKKQIGDINKKIEYVGYVNKTQLEKLYQESKITLVPSFGTEAFGRVIIESLINKTPVISSPNCGASYWQASRHRPQLSFPRHSSLSTTTTPSSGRFLMASTGQKTDLGKASSSISLKDILTF